MLEWEERFEAMLRFKRRFGHCNVPYKTAPFRQLGAWVFNQRIMHRRGILDAEVRARGGRGGGGEGLWWAGVEGREGRGGGAGGVAGREGKDGGRGGGWKGRG